MNQNFSPWLHQLKRTRPLARLEKDMQTDVAIVGGGIAGVMTAYFTLTETKRDVLLIEGNMIAHGATGHNAGQLTSYFEKTFAELVDEFGLETASQGQAAIESAWTLLEEMIDATKLQTPLYQFTGYAGCKDEEEIRIRLEDNRLRVQGGLQVEQLFIAEEVVEHMQLEDMYDGLYSVIPQKDILALLETEDTAYVATLAARKGCMNSALLCEELVGYLLATYPTRFTVLEHSLIDTVSLHKKDGALQGNGHTVTATHIVLCTNGFEHITIENEHGVDIDEKFHHLVQGSVGYMAGYLAPLDAPPIAISYLPRRGQGTGSTLQAEPYFYLTRRPFELEKNEHHNLICIGGPEALIFDRNGYHREHPYPNEAQEQIDTFLHSTYAQRPTQVKYAFLWHGLMGYTPNGVRCVGFEPCNQVLLYNLGCNGVGILPSIFGGKRISKLLAGENLPPSMFDPRDQRCELPKKK